MLQIQENVDIRTRCTLRVGGVFRYMVTITKPDDIKKAYEFAQVKHMPVFVLGGGSNIVFQDGVHECIALKIELVGFDVISETENTVDVKVGAGEHWDQFVEKTVSMGLSGVESLSAIPGTVGATPVQNVGAYGQEVKDTIFEVEVVEIETGLIQKLSNTDCHFSYRDSIFKNEAKGKYVIIAVVFRLSKKDAQIPNYTGVKKYFDEKGIVVPTLVQIRQAIIDIRKNKLPDPKEIPSVGSFFKNPIVANDQVVKLKEVYPTVTVFPVDETHTKVPAGWLIEHAGLKGKNFGTVSTYQHNALVLVNNGEATFKDIADTKDQIVETVFDKFGIRLEMEPEVV